MKNVITLILGCCSLLFYKLVVMTTLRTRKSAFWPNNKQSQHCNQHVVWQPLSTWLSKGKNNLLAMMMMMGPRWNCNATLAISDMFYVTDSIDFDLAQANASAKFWTAVVYNMDFKTIAHLGSGETDADGKLVLTPGHYFIAIRYYETATKSFFPRVVIDNDASIPARDNAEERVRYEEYLGMLSHYRSFLFLAMHYHAYAFLKTRHWLNADWVNKTYLPVGNPETQFTYGTVKKGQKIRVSSIEYPHKRTYISVYNKASLPIYWSELAEQQLTPPIAISGNVCDKANIRSKFASFNEYSGKYKLN